MLKRIHVNQHVIRRNKKTGDILGASRVVYSPDKPLSCGATVWIETDADIGITP